MPIYEYRCSHCHLDKEVYHKMSQKPRVICDKCKKKMHLIISFSNFLLKGEGFYVNDHKKK